MELATKHQTPAIPMEVIDTDDTHMTDMQARSLLPVNQDQWYKIRPQSLPVNPYAQSSMTTRRRIGRFDYVDKLDS